MLAEQLLNVAQAPAKDTACTQALLQQPDQLIHLPRSASRALLSSVRLRRLLRLLLLRASTSRRRRRHRFADCLWHHGPEMLMCGNRARDPRDVRRTDRDANTIFLRYHLIGVLGWLYPVGHPRTCPMCRTARSADLYCQLRRPGGASREPAGVT